MIERLGQWSELPFFSKTYPKIVRQLQQDDRLILPPEGDRFRALELCQPNAVRVVILGQDPYPTPGHAHGLSFSVADQVSPLPKSLKNIFKELYNDLGLTRTTGNLTDWADQGVLLLNSSLTVPAGAAGGHKTYGWSALIHEVIDHLQHRPIAFVLWGKHAQNNAPTLADHHLVLRDPHPSPLSAHTGFFGSRPFSRINNWLVERGENPIEWSHSERMD